MTVVAERVTAAGPAGLDRSTNPEAAKLPDYPGFDWLRIVLASAVALFHERVLGWPQSGNLAVLVFFALSGWLIGGILLRTEPAGLPRFYYNRGTRIWIPYACAVAAIYGLGALRDGIDAAWLRHLFYDVTFTHNWFSLHPDPTRALAEMPLQGTGNHFWSIAVEEQFYLVAPLAMLFLPFGRSAVFWAGTGGVLMLFGWNAAPISFGVAAAIWQDHSPNWHLRPPMRLSLALAAAATGAAMAFAPQFYWLAAPPFAIAVVLLCAAPGRRTRLGVFLGGLSYPFYLFHWTGTFALNEAVSPGENPPLWHRLAQFAAALLLSIIPYVLIDRNIQRYRSRFFTERVGRGFAIAAYGLALVGLAGGAAYLMSL